MSEAGCQNMAKTQKTFLLNSQLLELVDKVSERSGATFTRQVTAALLQYFFADPRGPDPRWMEYAVGLENSAITLGNIPGHRSTELSAATQRFTQLEGFETKCAQALWASVRSPIAGFRKMNQRAETDAIEKIIAHWASARQSD